MERSGAIAELKAHQQVAGISNEAFKMSDSLGTVICVRNSDGYVVPGQIVDDIGIISPQICLIKTF